ncbi:MAG: LLM class flavin-dependent oxidoreductase [Thermomicrobia bacterium]|nr:LLM class flavin-dependent oxidoreductase [Thermomicrobia bacterium]MCA1723507.1 LLM class flavin-dependent oxidoreductase [Thermomicrobia bacterium]
MRFCLSIEIQEGLDYAATLALARAGEAAGFDAALLAEHYYASSGHFDRMAADAWVYLGALARETERIRLGTLVSPVTFRHPAVLAKMAATLDQLSGGRAELGLGAGWLAAEHAAYGFPFASGPTRVDLLEEQLQVITGLWSEDPFSHTGPQYQLAECHFTPRPVQQPRLPLLIGGTPAATRLPRLAARYADEYVLGLGTPEQCRAVRERLDRDCTAAGRDPRAVSLALFAGLCVGETEQAVERSLARLMEGARPHMQNLDTWVLGTPERAAAQLRALAAAGVGRLMFSVDHELHREMVTLLGERVAPLVRAA